jgi:hypothetical protein
MTEREEYYSDLPLNVLVCDADRSAAKILTQALSRASPVLKVREVHSIYKAREALDGEGLNAIFIDPISLGLDEASVFIFDIRERLPEIVFVLYIDTAAAEKRRSEFYFGVRQRFSHYFTLDKKTPVAAFTDELAVVLINCQRDLSWRMSRESIARLRREADRLARSAPRKTDSQLLAQVRELLSRLPDTEHLRVGKVRGNTVFLSYRFADKEYVTGLTRLLQQSGFEVVTGSSANTYVSKAVLERIKECEFFLCLMTRDEKKMDGTYTTSPWLLEEKGAALALKKRLVLMVEEGVTGIGGLQGDWQRIHFGAKEFLTAALEAVNQLRSYGGKGE